MDSFILSISLIASHRIRDKTNEVLYLIKPAHVLTITGSHLDNASDWMGWDPQQQGTMYKRIQSIKNLRNR